MFTPERIAEEIIKIRRENGFDIVPFVVEDVIYEEEAKRLYIIGQDRADKSAIIGNSFVVGKLKERLGVERITVHSKLELLIKRRNVRENMEKVRGTQLEFLLPLMEAELNYPPMRWPSLKNNGRALVFLSVYAKALLGFARDFGLEAVPVGIRYSFPRLSFEPLDGSPEEIFFPNEERLVELAEEKGLDIVLADFPYGVTFREGIALVNPMRLLHIPHFRLKHIYGFEFPAYSHVDGRKALDFFVKLAEDGLLEPTDGAELIWTAWRRGRARP
ncbi:hypothetical protein [Palaeococcus ferrophilus]|uniref:hypothetical protein n=1 Tax=Palaeococcus ferrophilus TaxID=83868 RepID=UPI00064F6D1A|nr:hypothetical protein [Palaeococcus ferrophilus]